MRSKKKRTIYFIKGLGFWLLSLVVIVPFLIVIFNAFKTKTEAITMSLTIPKQLHFENFKEVWKTGNILNSYKNSLFISVTSVAISVFISAPAAYVLNRDRSKLNKALYTYFALGLMFPVSMVTIVKVLRVLHLYNSLWGVILLYIALILPMSIFLYYGFITGIPKELDEAAVIDGAGAFRVFFQVIFPLLKPATGTVAMINFLNTWNDFTVPLYVLPDPDKAVIVQQVYNFYGTFTASWNLVSVTILYAILPIVVIYLCGQKYIIAGMVSGAVKG
ncbi:carbohydrate ABC transporter permease [Lachnoclostridium sp.]|uniref:carbohydrate ABC transporter permease n=1 Tax=Lachnoclostridium sp. TaxID=2028282 RepID=UPI002899065A|nr:carbohydrate ABC transporter permease [Lachnoclostridium sp.]